MCLFDIDVTPRCVGVIELDGITSPAYSQFVLDGGNSVGFYNYYYLMLDNDKVLVHLSKNLRHSLNEEEFGNIKAIQPPLSEQQRIADYLDSQCAKIDSIADKIQSEIETLQQYRKSVIYEAVTKGLDPNVEMKDSGVEWIGKIPKNWQLIRTKYILNKIYIK